MSIPLDNATLNALINLLDEPDEHAYKLICDRILLQGMDVVPPLEIALENTFNVIVQERIRLIIRMLRQENSFVELSEWVYYGAADLLRGFFLVTKTEFPSLDEEDITIKIEQMKMDIWLELHEDLTSFENVNVINHLLFDIHRFDGNKSDMANPQNNYINSLLESKKGSPLSLGMLFIILAQKLGLPVYGVNLPQHFILAYLKNTKIENPREEDVLFYINPFNKGVVFTRREIELFIGQMKIKPEKSFFEPCSNSDIIHRLIDNLIFSYNQSGNTDKIEDLETLLTALE